ncbi:hypothetical protein SPRG_04416 [Saprolegnia parasitica CBS 223.65]|uniref:Uncharacterized protein n=1 Tax=Saprolegnia parasitica (strain CBS 223.65) TaxID=695850 RepID=A0A067CMQ1_SAPPC|nr:hypothetical protein SPRG_04416 [Saprolegnia parasitica CBS 223.65]KDO30515.1 hypothetical protein SPRG_04416 [Saprolegnia parasitica CBS 223.65]|eukprot:XP_012198730.1 hypothetical protein SPRG_04416 [Saprolegnia parasitica CBS 223.65]
MLTPIVQHSAATTLPSTSSNVPIPVVAGIAALDVEQAELRTKVAELERSLVSARADIAKHEANSLFVQWLLQLLSPPAACDSKLFLCDDRPSFNLTQEAAQLEHLVAAYVERPTTALAAISAQLALVNKKCSCLVQEVAAERAKTQLLQQELEHTKSERDEAAHHFQRERDARVALSKQLTKMKQHAQYLQRDLNATRRSLIAEAHAPRVDQLTQQLAPIHAQHSVLEHAHNSTPRWSRSRTSCATCHAPRMRIGFHRSRGIQEIP